MINKVESILAWSDMRFEDRDEGGNWNDSNIAGD
jgi:hypothetical protein